MSKLSLVYAELALGRAKKALEKAQRQSESDAEVMAAVEDYMFCKSIVERHKFEQPFNEEGLYEA